MISFSVVNRALVEILNNINQSVGLKEKWVELIQTMNEKIILSKQTIVLCSTGRY